jgi:endonuclease G
MKKLLVLWLVFVSITASAENSIDTSCPQYVIWGAPQITQEGNNQYLCKNGYALNYNYTTKVSYYAVEYLKRSDLVKNASRKDDFREDLAVPIQFRATLKDYQGSGLDRGHMAPAANHTNSAEAMSETFFLTNMMPQSPGNNRGIWKYLEENTRFWAQTYGEIYIITGTIFDGNSQTIGNGVKVPSFVYKIIIDPKRIKAISFLFPNIKLDPKTTEQYIVTIEQIETVAGINFSPTIPTNYKAIEQVKGKLEDW